MSEKPNAWVKPAEGEAAPKPVEKPVEAPKPEPKAEAPKPKPKKAKAKKDEPEAPKAPEVSVADAALRADRAGVYARQDMLKRKEDELLTSIRSKLTDAEYAFILKQSAPKRRKQLGDGAKKFLSSKFTGK